jgi:hypothetical protein
MRTLSHERPVVAFEENSGRVFGGTVEILGGSFLVFERTLEKMREDRSEIEAALTY